MSISRSSLCRSLTALALLALTPMLQATPAVALVRRFLADQKAGRYAQASAEVSLWYVPDLTRGQLAAGLAPAAALAAQGTTSPVDAAYALFADGQGRLGFRFSLLGPGALPNVVLVSALPLQGGTAMTLRVTLAGRPQVPSQILMGATVVNAATPDALGASRLPEARDLACQVISQDNLVQIGLAILQYAQGHDAHLPDADRWMDEITPFLRDTSVFHDPAAPASQEWCYAYNRNLSQTTVFQLDATATIALVFESDAGAKNAYDTGASLPQPGRHGGWTNFLSADGHPRRFRDGTPAGLTLALTPSPSAAPPEPKPAADTHAIAPTPDTPAVAAVRLYVLAHLAGQEDKAYALLSTNTQAQFPVAQREEMAKSITSPDMLKSLPPAVLPVLALFADLHDTLHFKFRVLGPSPDDPNLVLVRTYQVGTSPSTVKVLKVVTVADTGAGGAIRVDAEKTMLLAAPEMAKMRANAQQASSQSNLKQLSLAIIQYMQDHDETMPDADKWVDEIYPYVKTYSVFRDPSAPAGEKWSYTFNKNLSTIKLADLVSPATTVILSESTLGTKNASDTGESVPKPGRHNGGTDYAFSDGHVKWLSDATTPAPSFLLTGE